MINKVIFREIHKEEQYSIIESLHEFGYAKIKSYFNFEDALRMLFIGDGNCAEIVWSLMGISIPGWVLIACIQILVMSALALKIRT